MFQRFLTPFIIAVTLLCSIAPATAQTNNFGLGTNRGLSATGDRAGFSTDKSNNLYTWIGRIVNVALAVLMIVFFGFTLYAGFRWMLARDNADEVTEAKETIKASILGLIIVLLSYALSLFLFQRLST